jgi:hypothetical protein
VSEPAVSPSSDECPLCEAAIVSDIDVCPSCGMHLAGVGGRPVYTQPLFLWTAMGFLAVYLITLAVVVATK